MKGNQNAEESERLSAIFKRSPRKEDHKTQVRGISRPGGTAPVKERVDSTMCFRSSWTGTPGVGFATYGD